MQSPLFPWDLQPTGIVLPAGTPSLPTSRSHSFPAHRHLKIAQERPQSSFGFTPSSGVWPGRPQTRSRERLHSQAADPAGAPEARGTASAEAPVLTFKEIWNRSFCRPLEQLVDVIAEFPNEVEYIFRPSCVALQRCGGCCGDEGLRCVPVETSTVTMQLLKIKPNGEAPYVEMSFTEHKKCECRPRQDLMRLGRRRPKGRGKRRGDKKRRKDCELCGMPRR
ncbi:placenta growth factor isoform X1 [Oxyura jamaicensis]|uniref:placenta growth factor isoform X1 n=1 Tax=Oxyura jamaicensis TaxID=8884 RepID=UPI0015A71464|nr:placenta growth factor isoform X1 [Oxyura jamaicensis]